MTTRVAVVTSSNSENVFYFKGDLVSFKYYRKSLDHTSSDTMEVFDDFECTIPVVILVSSVIRYEEVTYPLPQPTVVGNTTIDFSVPKVKDYITGTSSITKNYSTQMTGFAIQNDGDSDLSFTINGLTITVKSTDGPWEDAFDPFTSVTITANSAFRAVVKG